MAFWKTGHADAEAAMIRMRPGFVESPNKFHQVARVLEGIAGFVVDASARRVASQRENVSNARRCVATQNRFDLILAVADTRQVRNRIQFRGVLNALDQIVGQIAR